MTTTHASERKVYRIAEITRLVKTVLEDEIGTVWIEGELSNVRRPSSGHIYFSLKDEDAEIKAVLFRGAQRGLRVEIRDGQLLRVQGRITVYEPRGQYQIIVQQVEEAGKGALQEAFEKLKKRLSEEGLFAPERKQPIPQLPQHIGIVTSPTGAAIRDILQVIARRFPNVHITIAPVRVQGQGAAEEIAHAIALLNKMEEVDVIITGRGGGSIEDLWCFNEEITARAVARSVIPVISAVGHEIDFTITDFAADLRAPTPSAAAELVVDRKDAFDAQIDQLSNRMVHALEQRGAALRNRLIRAAGSYVFHQPEQLVRQYRQRIDRHRTGMVHAAAHTVQSYQQRIDELSLKLSHCLHLQLQQKQQRLNHAGAQLRVLSPYAVLERGYSITRLADGTVVRDATRVQQGDQLTTTLRHGSIHSVAKRITTQEE